MTVTTLLLRLRDVFPSGKDLTIVQEGAYHAKLGRFSENEVHGIYDWVLENCKFFPKISDCYEAARMCGYLDKKADYKPHAWTETDCRLCIGSGLMAAVWRQEFTVDEQGRRQTLSLIHVGPYHRSAKYLHDNADGVRTVHRCKCEGGNAPTLEKGLPRWSDNHPAIIEKGWG